MKITDINVQDDVVSYDKIPGHGWQKNEVFDLGRYQLLWAVADYVDWESNNGNTSVTKNVLLENLSYEQGKQLRTELEHMKFMLDDVIYEGGYQKAKEFYGGDDSFSDMIEHIISLGKDFVKDIVKNEDSAWEYLQHNPPVEAFSYALPHEFDFMEKKKDYQQEAQDSIDEMESKISALNKVSALKDDYKKEVINEALTLAAPLRALTAGEDDKLQAIDPDILKSSLSHFKTFAHMAHEGIKTKASEPELKDKDYFSANIVDNRVVNLPINYLKEKQALEVAEKEDVDFSKFDQQYIDNFNNNSKKATQSQEQKRRNRP